MRSYRGDPRCTRSECYCGPDMACDGRSDTTRGEILRRIKITRGEIDDLVALKKIMAEAEKELKT